MTVARGVMPQPETLLAGSERIWPRMRRNAGVILGGRAIGGVLNLAASAVAVRAVGLEAFGVVALLQAYVRMIAGLLRFESWAAVTRYGTALYDAGAQDDLRRLLGFTLRLDAIAFALSVTIAAAAAPLVAAYFGWSEQVTQVAPFYALTIVFITGATPTGFLRLVDRFRVLAEQHALNGALRLTGALVLLAVGGGAVALTLVWALAGILSGAYMLGIAWGEARRRGLTPRFRGRWSTLSQGLPGIWRFMGMTNATSIVETVMSHATVLMVGAVLGTTGASLYAVVRQLTESLGKLSSLLGPVVFPEVALLEARGRRDRIRRLVWRSVAISGLILAASLAILWLAAEPLLVTVFGPETAPAVPLLIGAGAAAGLRACGFALAPALLSLGREMAVFRSAVAATVLFVPLMLGLMQVWGLLGAGVALAVWQGIIFAARVVILKVELARRPA